ncbi:MAG: UDP-N-acetylglucosamine 4,6-dehydratase (inverting) [Acidiferrobacteraceae bacterium]|nr:UDP-N-acetylglucosamine 4,6-dehydratase (inverting) [Acidiferrobacteraceae bacterium]
MLGDKSVLITGGTGSLGQALVKEILRRWPAIKRVVVFSRDELKQYDMRQKFPEAEFPSLRFFLGDVRDIQRLRRAFNRVDVVIHAAALKQVPAAEYNPVEFIRTNVMGAENVVEAAMDTGVETIVALSTDKAAAPVNLYGATKLCSDKLFVAARSYAGSALRCVVVRYGNVMGSRGSVVPFFLEKAKTGVLPITHPDMTRFNITLGEGVDLVLWAIENTQGGEIMVPKIPSYRVTDLAKAIDPGCRQEIVGVRPGEKIHEEMLTVTDGRSTIDLGKYFAVLPDASTDIIEHYKNRYGAKLARPGFSYNSRDNDLFLSVSQLRALIQKHVGCELVVG